MNNLASHCTRTYLHVYILCNCSKKPYEWYTIYISVELFWDSSDITGFSYSNHIVKMQVNSKQVSALSRNRMNTFCSCYSRYHLRVTT